MLFRSLWILAIGASLLLAPPVGFPQESGPARPVRVPPLPSPRDGSRDFDFEIGVWTTHLSRLSHPLTGSTTWLDYEGTTTVRSVWNGRANLVELEVDGPAGHIEALSLRLYNPESHQWSLNFSNSAAGTMAIPSVGDFHGSRGEFYTQESLGSRSILTRFVILNRLPNAIRFEQAFSADGGKTWELNWIATDTRSKTGVPPA